MRRRRPRRPEGIGEFDPPSRARTTSADVPRNISDVNISVDALRTSTMSSLPCSGRISELLQFLLGGADGGAFGGHGGMPVLVPVGSPANSPFSRSDAVLRRPRLGFQQRARGVVGGQSALGAISEELDHAGPAFGARALAARCTGSINGGAASVRAKPGDTVADGALGEGRSARPPQSPKAGNSPLIVDHTKEVAGHCWSPRQSCRRALWKSPSAVARRRPPMQMRLSPLITAAIAQPTACGSWVPRLPNQEEPWACSEYMRSAA